jgi:hypothetical protein
MKLNVGERLRLLGILPEKGNLVTIKVVSEMRNSIALSEKEIKGFKVKVGPQSITWDDKAKPVDIKLGDTAKEVIVNALRELDEKEELTVSDVALWEMFIGEVK